MHLPWRRCKGFWLVNCLNQFAFLPAFPPTIPPSTPNAVYTSPSHPSPISPSFLTPALKTPSSSPLPPPTTRPRCRRRLCNAGGNASWSHPVRWGDYRERRQKIQAVLRHEFSHCHAEVLWRCCRVPVRSYLPAHTSSPTVAKHSPTYVCTYICTLRVLGSIDRVVVDSLACTSAV